MSGSITTWTSIEQIVAPGPSDRRSSDVGSRADGQARFDEHLDRAIDSNDERSQRASDDAVPVERIESERRERIDSRARFERRHLGHRGPMADDSSPSATVAAIAAAPSDAAEPQDIDADPAHDDHAAPVVAAIDPPPAALTAASTASTPTITPSLRLLTAGDGPVASTPIATDAVQGAVDGPATRPVDAANTSAKPAAPLATSLVMDATVESSSLAGDPLSRPAVVRTSVATPSTNTPSAGDLDPERMVGAPRDEPEGSTVRLPDGEAGSGAPDVAPPTVASTVPAATGAEDDIVAAPPTTVAAVVERARPARPSMHRGGEPAAATSVTDGAIGASPGPVAELVDGPAATPRPVATVSDAAPVAAPLGAERRAPVFEAMVADPAMAHDTARTERTGGTVPVSVPHLSVDLSDEGLGPLTLQAQQGADGVHVRLTAADARVSDLLSRAGGELRHDLQSSGVALGSLDIAHGDLAHGHAGGDRQPSSTAARPAPPAAPTATSGLTPGVEPLRPGTSPRASAVDGVDVRI